MRNSALAALRTARNTRAGIACTNRWPDKCADHTLIRFSSSNRGCRNFNCSRIETAHAHGFRPRHCHASVTINSSTHLLPSSTQYTQRICYVRLAAPGCAGGCNHKPGWRRGGGGSTAELGASIVALLSRPGQCHRFATSGFLCAKHPCAHPTGRHSRELSVVDPAATAACGLQALMWRHPSHEPHFEIWTAQRRKPPYPSCS